MNRVQNNLHNDGGYIALLLVLLVSAATLAISLSLLSSGTDSQRALLVSQQSVQARSLATACAEEALQQLHDNNSFTTTGTSMTLTTGTCSYIVSASGSNRTINTSSSISNVVRKLRVTLTLQTTQIIINTWQDVT